MSEMTPKLLAAYESTWIHVDLPSGVFLVPPANQGTELNLPSELEPWFVVITAFNPGSEVLTDDENKARQAELWNAVRIFRTPCFSAIGRSEDGSWGEESVAVVQAQKQMALALARKFGQLAVFSVDERGCRVEEVPAGLLSEELDEELEALYPRCPSCGSKDVVHVMYGLVMLDEIGNRAVDSGRLRLGGCLVGSDSYPFECNECSMKWNDPDEWDPQP